MKKFLLLIVALLGTVGAMATVTQPTLTTDVNNPHYYTIKNFRSEKYATYAGPSTQLSQIATPNYASLWYFVANGEGVSIVPAADPSVKLATNASATADGAVWYLVENPYNAGYFCVSLKSDLSANCWDDQGSSTKVGYYNPRSSDYQGTSWIIEESSVTFATRKSNIQTVINNLPEVLKPTAKTDALNNATTDAQMIAAVSAFSANVTFKCRSNNYLVVGDSKGAHVASPSNYEEIIQLVSVGDGSFYMKGFMSTKYLANVAMSTAIQTEANANTPYFIQAYGDYAVARPTKYADTGGSPNYEGYHYIHNGGSGCVGWEASNTNCQYTITEVDIPAGYVAVTYNVEVDGNVVATETLRQVSGNAAAVPSVLQRDYTTYSYDPTTIPANDATITVTPTFNMPFTTSADYANATWYYLRGHASYGPGSGYGESRYISTNGTATVWAEGKSANDAHKWAFIGNPITGIKVINKASGDGSYLMDTDPSTMGSTAKAWTLKQQTTNYTYSGENGFGLYDSALKYLNAQSGTLKYWTSFDQGSTYWVEEIPKVTVTFNLEVDGTTANTITQEVPEGETVSVPTELWANYNTSLAYTISGAEDVTVGTTDQTVTVTATLKSGVVTSLTNLSNTKKYKITCIRGSLSTYTDGAKTYLASPCKTALGIEGKEFAILNYLNRNYLYSVSDEKFVTFNGANSVQAPLKETVTGTIDAISFTETTSAVYAIKFNDDPDKFINSSASYAYGIVINDYGKYSGEFDDGNQYVIEEVDDFDSSTALSALTTFFDGQVSAYNAIIAELKAINWGLEQDGNKGKVNYYNFVSPYTGYAGNEVAIIEQCEAHGYDSYYYNIIQGMSTSYALNMPTAGMFFRFKRNTNYLTNTATTASGFESHIGMKNVADNSTLFYFDGTHLIDYGAGLKMNGSLVSSVGNSGKSVTFAESKQTAGRYSVKVEGDTYLRAYDGAGYIWDAATEEDGTQWYLEEVTTLPVTISSVGYATFCSPVAVTIPTGVTAYKAEDKGNYLKLTAISDAIPANEGVILAGAVGSYDFAVTTTDATVDDNALAGTVAAISRPTDSYILSTSGGANVGFYKDGASTIPGFKAYLPASSGTNVKFFSFEDDEDAINSLFNENGDAEIYNLAGQRINKLQKGVNIVNGKKVLVK